LGLGPKAFIGEGLGVGGSLRVGYTFESSIYTGLYGSGHMGEGWNAVSAAAELGYAFRMGRSSLRPGLRGGVVRSRSDDYSAVFVSPVLGLGLSYIFTPGEYLFAAELDAESSSEGVCEGDMCHSVGGLGVYLSVGKRW
jgi:hypothetical protein